MHADDLLLAEIAKATTKHRETCDICIFLPAGWISAQCNPKVRQEAAERAERARKKQRAQAEA